MTRITLAMLLMLLGGGCLGVQPADYADVSFSELTERPWQYEGQRVRVRGYLISLTADAQLAHPTNEECYSNEHLFITTSLARSSLGALNGTHLEYDGHLVTVVGTFENSGRPWRPDPLIGSPSLAAVGPLRGARIESISEQHCLRIGESNGLRQ